MGCIIMPTGKPKRFYSGEFKQQVVEAMEKEKLSYREAARRFGVPDHKIVARWERHYLEEGVPGLYLEHRGRAKSQRVSTPPKEVAEDLIAEMQRLRAEVDYLKKLNALVLKREQREKKQK